MQTEYIRKKNAINIAESYEVKRDGFHLNDYEYGRNQVADSIASDLEDMPPADVEPVAYGRWVYVDDDDMRYDTYYCSECRNRITVDSHRRDDIGFTSDDMKRCNKCGAIMDAKEKG